jgi:predicted ATPase
MIRTFRAQNYGCLKDIEARLSPIHAFIGPNDSGKSTILRGLRTVVQFAGGTFEWTRENGWEPFNPDLQSPNGSVTHAITLACDVDNGSYTISAVNGDLKEIIGLGAGFEESFPRRYDVHSDLYSYIKGIKTEEAKAVLDQLRSALMLRFDPDALRAPSGLIPESKRITFLDERGHGLPGVYFALRNRGDDAFEAVVASTRRHFPTVKTFRLKPVTTSTLEIEIELQNGVRVVTVKMSEGLLYFLAFAALRYLDPPSLLLIEEPENGLHPARIREVVRMLRVLAEEMNTQVVMATHSPLVINELKPEEVTIVTRPSVEEGTRLTPIRETHNFEKRSSVYALGELWLSYADGETEGPLIKGPDA